MEPNKSGLFVEREKKNAEKKDNKKERKEEK